MSEYVEYFRKRSSVNSDPFNRLYACLGDTESSFKGLMFALVADDTLYLKADETISQHFTELELEQFSYEKKGKSFKMSYYMAPEEIFDDPEEANVWASRSYAAAVRSNKPKRKPTKKPKKKK